MSQQRLHQAIYEEMGIASEMVAPFLESLYAQKSITSDVSLEESSLDSGEDIPQVVEASKAKEKSGFVQIEQFENAINSTDLESSGRETSFLESTPKIEKKLDTPIIESSSLIEELSAPHTSEESLFYIEGPQSSKVGILMSDIFSCASKTSSPIKEDILFHHVKQAMKKYIPDLCFIHYQGGHISITQYQTLLEQSLNNYAIDYLMVLGQSFYSLVDTRTIPEELRGSLYHLVINDRLFHLVYSYQMSSLFGSSIRKQALWDDFMFLLKHMSKQ